MSTSKTKATKDKIHHIVLDDDATIMIRSLWNADLDMPMVSVLSVLECLGIQKPDARALMRSISEESKLLCHIQEIEGERVLAMPLLKMPHLLRKIRPIRLSPRYRDNYDVLVEDGQICVYDFWYGTSRYKEYHSKRMSNSTSLRTAEILDELATYSESCGAPIDRQDLRDAVRRLFDFAVSSEKPQNKLTALEDIRLAVYQASLVSVVRDMIKEEIEPNNILTQMDAKVIELVNRIGVDLQQIK